MIRLLLLICFAGLMIQCADSTDDKLFVIRHGEEVGIDFQNRITVSDSLNALTFEYIYNGGGIGVGDFNNDGLEDLFMGGNQVSSELYLNQGGLEFKKSTLASGVATKSWITGVSVVDINGDGWLDVYLSVGGKVKGPDRANLLFINKGATAGIPVFEEQAEHYHLNDTAYSTMAAFLDYDKDGDQDMYLVNNWLEQYNRNNIRPVRVKGEAESTDKLYRNNGDNTFIDVSAEAGILIEGYGLGVNVTDINADAWPDIYVSNDFLSSDILWVNNGDGTFTDRIGHYTRHQAHNGMGIDIADFNNDALADIAVVDMLPPGHQRQKLMTPGQNYDHFHMSIAMGVQPQYMRNTLQLNRGFDNQGNPSFSEIGFLSGAAQTDWSWAPLFADFNNDGWKDLFIANGYRKDVTNLDFIFFGLKRESPFGTPEARKKITDDEFRRLDDVKLSNYLYLNNGSLRFDDVTSNSGFEYETFSNGAAYADFDLDGDLDLITNNIDQPVTLYENLSNQKQDNAFISFRFTDPDETNQKVWIYDEGKIQYQEFTPYRGFQSSVTRSLHFGIGSNTKSIDSVIVEWNNGALLKLENVRANETVLLNKPDEITPVKRNSRVRTNMFSPVTPVLVEHREKSESDLKLTRTLLHELSRSGPCMAKGDVNNDGLDDFFFGAEYGERSKIFIQTQNGTFTPYTLPANTSGEDGAALFFDANNDGYDDLYVASGCHISSARARPHTLFINQRDGTFKLSGNLPEIRQSSAVVTSADIDADGDNDLFVGGTFRPGAYPLPDRSYILRNDGGTFTDITEEMNSELLSPGIITDAVWADINLDRRPDLVMCGEWMPIRVFINDGKLIEKTGDFGISNLTGWWKSLKVADLNRDGFLDVLAGNTGENSFFRPSAEHPVKIFARDFDSNGSMDPVVTYYNPIEGDDFVIHNRLVLIDQIPAMKKRFETFTQYATTPFGGVFTPAELSEAYTAEASTLSSMVLINEGGHRFSSQKLPHIAQISTLNDFVVTDINGDKHADILAIGNDYQQETLFGRYDASIGLVLLNDGKARWTSIEPTTCGFYVDGDTRQMEMLRTTTGKLLVVAMNNAPAQFFQLATDSVSSGKLTRLGHLAERRTIHGH